MKKLASYVLFFLMAAVPVGVQAQDVGSMRNTAYLGFGSAKGSGPYENDDTQFSLGFMHQRDDGRSIIGFDIGGEGTMLDSTWGQSSAPKRATSLNLLVGGNVFENGRFRTDAALLIGVREATSDCPSSYLGYQCYADTKPNVDYKGNIGGVVTFSFANLAVGLRVTGESTQALVGVRF